MTDWWGEFRERGWPQYSLAAGVHGLVTSESLLQRGPGCAGQTRVFLGHFNIHSSVLVQSQLISLKGKTWEAWTNLGAFDCATTYFQEFTPSSSFRSRRTRNPPFVPNPKLSVEDVASLALLSSLSLQDITSMIENSHSYVSGTRYHIYVEVATSTARCCRATM
ncbi:hypothetical protein SCHPADRAFT_296798 [Schizopora paradoxa]|uniref:Uncharacterized protein n=1 Tax=Schizopora paradoxa TaxID=27342 RepID=A0A0H2RRW3_9AGAM|nr:hypothetical protein SCHPADRAFT_296798 [Schizopora paradoxa]